MKGRVYKMLFTDTHLIQLAVNKTRFFTWYVGTKCYTARRTLDFWHQFASYPIAFMSHDWITYDINMTLMWWMGVAKSRYQFISSTWGFLSMVTSWFVSNIDNTSIWIWTFLKCIFSSFLTKSGEQLFQPAFRLLLLIISCVKNNISKNFGPLRKTCPHTCLFPFWNTK